MLRPTTYFVGGFLVCPDDGRMRWQSGRCRCGARLIGPGKRSKTVNATVRTWLIYGDGEAVLLAPGEPARPYNLMLPAAPRETR